MDTTEVSRISSASFSSPIRTVTVPGSCEEASSLSTTTCSSSASRIWRSEPGKSAALRVRLAVPPSSSRSSGCSTSVSISTVASVVTTSRSSAGAVSGRSATAADAAASGRPASAPLSITRSVATSSSVSTSPRSTTRWSTRPESVISTSISRAGVSATISQVAHRGAGQRRVLHDGDLAGELGEQPDAAAQHVVEVDRAVQERLHGPALGRGQRLDLARAGRRTAGSPCRWAPGPALVCGWAISPSSSSTAMSLRTVALETPRLCRSTIILEPTGSWVET